MDPDAIAQAEFSTALRGYDREEVDAYLRKVAVEHRRLLAATTSPKPGPEKPLQRFGQDVGDLLQQAKDVADRMKQRADEEGGRLREEAKKFAKEMKEKAKHDAQQIKQAAEYEASERTKDAQRRLAELSGMEAKAKERLDELRARFRTVLDQLESLTVGASAEARGVAEGQGAGEDQGVTTAQGDTTAEGAATAQPAEAPGVEHTRDGSIPAAEGAKETGAEEGSNGNNVVIHIDAEGEDTPIASKS
jgi:DivIVA domain-containing protein